MWKTIYCIAGKFGGGIKFGGLVVCLSNCQIKICQYFLLAFICIAIPYQTASANIFAMVILGLTAFCQYFQLYGISKGSYWKVECEELVATYITLTWLEPFTEVGDSLAASTVVVTGIFASSEEHNFAYITFLSVCHLWSRPANPSDVGCLHHMTKNHAQLTNNIEHISAPRSGEQKYLTHAQK